MLSISTAKINFWLFSFCHCLVAYNSLTENMSLWLWIWTVLLPFYFLFYTAENQVVRMWLVISCRDEFLIQSDLTLLLDCMKAQMALNLWGFQLKKLFNREKICLIEEKQAEETILILETFWLLPWRFQNNLNSRCSEWEKKFGQKIARENCGCQWMAS